MTGSVDLQVRVPATGYANAVVEDAIDDAAASAMPPVTNCLILHEYLPAEVLSKLREALSFLERYTWFSEENFNRASKCCEAAVALSQGSVGPPPVRSAPQSDYQFFIDVITN